MSVDPLYLLACATWQLHGAVLMGNAPLHIRMLYEELSNPGPGDLVMEKSSICMAFRDGDFSRHFGRLIIRRVEAVKYEEGDETYNDTFWYIERFDGGLQRWSNCSFIKVLEVPFEHSSRPPLVADRTAWVRDALVRHAADMESFRGKQ